MTFRLLKEDGDGILLENGDDLLLESTENIGGLQPLFRQLHAGYGAMQQVPHGLHRYRVTMPGGGGFSYDMVTADGTNDELNRGAALSAVADSPFFTLSMRIKHSQTGVQMSILSDNLSATCTVMFNASDNKLEVALLASDLLVFDVDTLLNDGIEHHVAISANTQTGVIRAYVDRVVSTVTTVAYTGPFDVPYSARSEWYLLGVGGFSRFNGDIGELWISFDSAIDFSNSANLDKFVDGSSNPISLGADGSTPTGSQPVIYLHIPSGGAPNNFATNLGDGGGFTLTGSLT